MRSSHLALIPLAFVAASDLAHADETIPFRVDYVAPPDCPDARTFTKAITGRSDRVKVATGPDATSFHIELRLEEHHYVGQIRISPPNEKERARAVDGERCAEVADALALIAAFALDPEARSVVSDKPAERAPEPPPPPPPAPPAQPGLTWSFGFGAHLIPLSGAIPEPGVGFGASLEAEASGRTLAPSIRVIGERSSGGTVSRTGGSARFSLTTFTAELCPLRAPPKGVWSARPCAGFETGALGAEGIGVRFSKSPTRLWVAPRVSGRFEWQFARPVLAAIETGLSFPLKRQHYSFDSGEPVFDEPSLVGFATLGIGARFP